MSDRSKDGNREGPTNRVKSVETALSIIETLHEIESGTLTEIANHNEMAKGTAYKHLSTLTENGLVIKSEKEYSLSYWFLDIGVGIRSKTIGSTVIRGKIKELAELTDEAALFSVREKGKAVTLFRESGNKGVPTRTRPGSRLPVNQTAGGKAILAFEAEDDVRNLLEAVELRGATAETITDKRAFLDELDEIRAKGYAFNMGESTKGLFAVAAPVIPEERVIGACSIAGPKHRLDNYRLTDELPDILLSVVNDLELNIAYSYQKND